jgi:hypothetical protein
MRISTQTSYVSDDSVELTVDLDTVIAPLSDNPSDLLAALNNTAHVVTTMVRSLHARQLLTDADVASMMAQIRHGQGR